jgi:hypothetical protein
MARSKAMTLPEMGSMDELVDFFEAHDMGAYWEQMPEAGFEVKIKGRKHLVALEEDVAAQVTQIAKEKKVPSEALINAWLKEKLRKAG